jgi:predicted ArsR family transcriptional regulator
MQTHSDQRFFASTRGQIVALLRRAARTVDDLARSLDLTDNAVRAHLATLERDGLVQQHGMRRGVGKPAYAYRLTPAAERLFPRVYDQVLGQLLTVLQEQYGSDELLAIVRATGRRLAVRRGLPTGERRARVAGAVDALNEWGGLLEYEESGDAFVIRGHSCPFASVVPEHPESCRLVEALLAEFADEPVLTECGGEVVGCRFRVPAPPVES